MSPALTEQRKFLKAKKVRLEHQEIFFTVNISGRDYHVPKAKSIRCPTEALNATHPSQSITAEDAAVD